MCAVAALAAPAHALHPEAEAGPRLDAELRLGGGYAENPYLDYLDEQVREFLRTPYASALPRLQGLLPLGADQQLSLDLSLRYERYFGAQVGTSWWPGAALRYELELLRRLRLGLGADGSWYRIDVFPLDQSWYAGGSADARLWLLWKLSLHASYRGGWRRYPRRDGIEGDPTARQEDLVQQARAGFDVGALAWGLGVLVWGADWRMMRIGSNAPGLRSTLQEGSLWLHQDLWRGGVYAWGSVGRRSFDAQLAGDASDALRADEVVGAGARLWQPALDWLDVALSYSFSRSDSSSVVGRWRQHLGGLELRFHEHVGGGGLGARAVSRGSAAGALRPGAPRRVQAGWRFEHEAAGARKVCVVGSFNAWTVGATPLEDPDGDGVWSGVAAVPQGRHQFMFVEDETRWVAPAHAEAWADDDFGQRVGVLWVWE